jgi:hypothetical protein
LDGYGNCGKLTKVEGMREENGFGQISSGNLPIKRV